MRRTIFTGLVPLIMCVHAAQAQAIITYRDQGRDLIQEHTFAPDLVMKNQTAIDLSEEQRTQIVQYVREAQAQFTEWQWELERRMETFTGLLGEDRIDAERARAELDSITQLERQIKLTNLLLAIRIKNLLSPEQQKQLRDIRRNSGEYNYNRALELIYRQQQEQSQGVNIPFE